MPHHGRARGTRRVPPRPTPCRGTASTSSPTPRPGWRRSGDPTCTAAPTSPCTSTRPVSAARPGWARRDRAGHRSHAVPAVKLDPPPDGMNFAKAKGLLQLRVPRPPFRGRDRALSREARFRGVGNLSWTQVKPWWRGAGGGSQRCEQPWMQRGGSGTPSPPGWVLARGWDRAATRNRIREGLAGITQAKPRIRIKLMADEILTLLPARPECFPRAPRHHHHFLGGSMGKAVGPQPRGPPPLPPDTISPAPLSVLPAPGARCPITTMPQ